MWVKSAMGSVGLYLFGERLKGRFVAGSTLQEAVDKAKFFKSRGERAVINILGEHAKDNDEANKVCRQILELIALLKKEGLTEVNIAEKPSQLGLGVSKELYRRNKFLILSAAQEYLPRAFVETDAEDHLYRKQVLEVALHFNAGGFTNQLLACQLNRRQSLEEIKLLQYAGIPVRICKGAYPGDIKEEKKLRVMFLGLAGASLVRGQWTAFGTHDLFLIDYIAKDFAEYKNKFEFELLMGMEENLPRESHLHGYAFRRYIPCDPFGQWRAYGKRRAEALLGIWLRNFLYRAKAKARGSRHAD